MQDLDVKNSKMLALFVLLRIKIVVCTIVRSNRALVAKNVNSGELAKPRRRPKLHKY